MSASQQVNFSSNQKSPIPLIAVLIVGALVLFVGFKTFVSVPAGHRGVATLFATPTASSYGSGNNGCPGDGRKAYAQAGKPSLWSRARAEGGHLNRRLSLWLMGFPEDWLET